jgi:hypothetical protein
MVVCNHIYLVCIKLWEKENFSLLKKILKKLKIHLPEIFASVFHPRNPPGPMIHNRNLFVI